VTDAREDRRGRSMKSWVRALEMTAPIATNARLTLPVLIDDLADRFNAAPALVSKQACLTYRSLSETANRYARWAQAQGLTAGDVVCLLMPNCPDYMAIWLGITRVGAIVSLLNTELTGDLLVHSIGIVAPRHVIVGAMLARTLAGIRSRLPASVQCWVHGDGGGHDFRDLDAEIARTPGDRLAASEIESPSITDRALYIYTSGTTGSPKAAAVSHYRLMQWSHWFCGLMDVRPSDRMYDCLPMYHGVGGVVATGAALVGGATVVLRERFSASDFWRDVVDERCTLFQYIGELCRYLVKSPWQVCETDHRLRLCCGNGLRADIWDEFKTRFRIPHVLEYYASTEGNFSLYNCEDQPGSIGRIPPFLAHRLPVAIVKVDAGTGAPVRDGGGACMRCAPDEVGEALGQIVDGRGSLAGRFEGYSDAAASARKVLRDVFVRGDAWYRTGDLMRQDARGFFYFVDRAGDNYRWKGQNISSTEVAAALAACRGVTQALVYGVIVPGTEGRAGMAALVVDADFDLARFREETEKRLPEYAQPVFVRILRAIEMTGTHKPRKQQLATQGYDPLASADAVYIDDRSAQAYVRLDADAYERLQSGSHRF
jgi:fatty-acyl-CoA synthase